MFELFPMYDVWKELRDANRERRPSAMLPMGLHDHPALGSFLNNLTISCWAFATVANYALTLFFESHPGAPLTRLIIDNIIGSNSFFVARFNDLQKFDGISGYCYAAAMVSGMFYLPIMLAMAFYKYLVLIIIPRRFSPPTLVLLKGFGYTITILCVFIWVANFWNLGISAEKYPSYSRIFTFPYSCFMGFSGPYLLWFIFMEIFCLFAKILVAGIRMNWGE